MWHNLRFVANIRTNKKLATAKKKKTIYTCTRHKTKNKDGEKEVTNGATLALHDRLTTKKLRSEPSTSC